MPWAVRPLAARGLGAAAAAQESGDVAGADLADAGDVEHYPALRIQAHAEQAALEFGARRFSPAGLYPQGVAAGGQGVLARIYAAIGRGRGLACDGCAAAGSGG